MHLAADMIPLELCITRQQVPQLLVRLGNCLVMSLLKILEHLLGLLDLHLASLNINDYWDSVLRSRGFEEILQRTKPPFNSLWELPILMFSPFWLMIQRTATMCIRYSLVFPWEYMGMLRWELSGSLTFKDWSSSLGVTISVLGMYGMGIRLLSCPFLHSAFFNPSVDLRVVLILVWCQSPVLSRSFLKEDFGGTRRNPAARIVAWRFAECKNFLVPEKTRLCQFCTYDWLDGLYRKKSASC